MKASHAYSQPTRLLKVASWAIAIAFAVFLNMLGALVIRDLMYAPRGGPPIRAQFADAATSPLDTQVRDLHLQLDALNDKIETTRIAHARADKIYSDARGSFRNWIATRQATGDRQNDPDLLARTHSLDQLQGNAADWQRQQNALVDEARPIDAHLEQLRNQIAAERKAADERYEAASRRYELVVFGWRLALTLPLLVAAVWLFIRCRNFRYWPFVYGFGMFALTAFFVELVFRPRNNFA
jgi:outer membrane murein-binding lipoprotein Lpp